MFNQIPYMMANPMYGAASMMPGLASSAAPSALASTASKGTSLLSKLNWSSLLSNAQKTLNVVNQAIPLYYQVKPVFNNIKTLGRIGKEFTKASSGVVSPNIQNNAVTQNNVSEKTNISNNYKSDVPEPKFFL